MDAIYRHRSLFLAALTCLAISACGGGRDDPPVLASITVSPSGLTLDALDATSQLQATARDQNGNTFSTQLSWSSSDTDVVSVSADGQVTALGNGTVTVTVRSGSVSASANVTVEQAPASIVLSREEVLLTALGADQQLEARVLDANGVGMSAQLTWASSDPAVAAVDEDGTITAQANGTATVTVSIGSISASATATVEQAVSTLDIVLETGTLTEIGESTQLRVMALDANGYPIAVDVSLSSSDPAIASVNEEGVVTAQANGMATITATVHDQGRDVSESVAIAVQAPIAPPDPFTVTGDPNVRDSSTGRTPLHTAAMANAPKLIAGLLAAGADIEARDTYDMTPLHLAAQSNAALAIDLLVDAGADLEARNRFRDTPLQFAMSRSNLDTTAAIVALLEAGADPNPHIGGSFSLVSRATTAASHAPAYRIHGAMATLHMVLEAGADPNANYEGGQPPLFWAVQGDRLDVLTTLLEAGADPNAPDIEGWTPMWYWAELSANSEFLAPMLDAGGDLEARDNVGTPLLHHAAAQDNPYTTAALLQAGANPNSRDHRAERTALHTAAGSAGLGPEAVSAAAAIAALLEGGADPNARDNRNFTPLQRVHESSMGVAEALFDAHAGRSVLNPNARDAIGRTALHAAARANSRSLIAALVRAGADVNALDNEGNTPLLLAAGPRTGPDPTFGPAAIAALAAAGADLEVRDTYGFTALHWAAFARETAAIEALQEAGANPVTLDPHDRTALQVALAESGFGESDRAAIVALAEAEANHAGGEYNDFAAVVALAMRNPAALAEAGRDLEARDQEGRTVLHWLMGWDDSVASAVLAALIEAGADLNARDYVGRTAVHWAVLRRNAKMIAALVEAGADLDVSNIGRTALHQAVTRHNTEMVAALVAAGADMELRDGRGWTAVQLAAHEGQPAMVSALARAGADLEVRDRSGRTALQLAANRDVSRRWDGGPSTPAAVAALLESGANIDASDEKGISALHASATAGNRGATGILLAFGASRSSGAYTDIFGPNARIVAVELFQGPMVWQWRADQSALLGGRSGWIQYFGDDHAKTLLGRAATMAVRIGSRNSEPMPGLSVSLNDADGRTWTTGATLARDPYIVSSGNESESGLWESEYVYELPADWVDSGRYARLVIDPLNQIDEIDENDNIASLIVDGYAVPVFDVTFVPIVFSGDVPAVNTDTYIAVIGDLLPIGDYRAKVGRVLDLSEGIRDVDSSQLNRAVALTELQRRWNAEAGENEYYHGVISTKEADLRSVGGLSFVGGHVSVSDFISAQCPVDIQFCGDGDQAHEIGHNFGLLHLPGLCGGHEPVDHAFPYDEAGIGPRRGWVASRDEFVNPGNENRHYELMGHCHPRFVSDYNYNKMVEFRMGTTQSPTEDSVRIGPSLLFGLDPSAFRSAAVPYAPAISHAPPSGAESTSDIAGRGDAVSGIVEEIGPSLAFAGVVDEYGLWSTGQIAASTQPARSPSTAGAFFFSLQDAYQREIYREPMTLLTSAHGDTRRSWAVRVPVPELPPAFLAILDARGTPLFIEPIDELPDGLRQMTQ